MAATAFTANEVRWFENLDSVGSSWASHLIESNYDHAIRAYTGNLDSDGDIDLVGTAYFGNEIAWWENRGGQFGLLMTDVAPANVVGG